MSNPALAPAQTPISGRIVGVDVARTLALLGMFAAHIGPRYGDAPQQVEPLFQLVAGRSSALFAVLAGVSLVLMSAGTLAADSSAVGQVRRQIVIRAAAVASIGVILGTADSGVAVILVNYGLLFLLALPVITWGWRRLMALTVLWLALSPVATWVIKPILPLPSGRPTSIFSLMNPLESLSEVLVTGYYPVLTWGTYLFLGMALARLDLRRGRVALGLFVVGTVGLLASLAVSGAYTASTSVQQILLADVGFEPEQWGQLNQQLQVGWSGDPSLSAWSWMPVWAPHTSTTMDLVQTCASSIAIIGASLLCTEAIPGRWRRTWQIFWGAGAMTLTLYVGHVLVLSAPESLPGSHSLIAHTLGAMLLGMVFAATNHRGPLEALLREMTKPSKTPRSFT